jgi:hypothetical protein
LYYLWTLLTQQIISNTTIARPPPTDAHPLGQETGGLSGKPLFDSSTRVLRDMYILTGVCVFYPVSYFSTSSIPVIAVFNVAVSFSHNSPSLHILQGTVPLIGCGGVTR